MPRRAQRAAEKQEHKKEFFELTEKIRCATAP